MDVQSKINGHNIKVELDTKLITLWVYGNFYVQNMCPKWLYPTQSVTCKQIVDFYNFFFKEVGKPPFTLGTLLVLMDQLWPMQRSNKQS